METERDRLIRTGVLTPFDSVSGFERRVQRRGGQQGPVPPAAAGKLKALAAKVTRALPPPSRIPPFPSSPAVFFAQSQPCIDRHRQSWLGASKPMHGYAHPR